MTRDEIATGEAVPAIGPREEHQGAQRAIRALVDYLAAEASLGPPPHRLDAISKVIIARTEAQASARLFLETCERRNTAADARDAI